MVETTGELARTLETISRLGSEVLPRLRRPPVALDTNGTPRPTGSQERSRPAGARASDALITQPVQAGNRTIPEQSAYRR